MTFWIILKLVLIGLALFSYLSYKSRRSDNHGALAQLRQAPVLRTLTPDEALALEPLRVAGGLSWAPEVRALRGRFSRHGIEVNGAQTLHDTLGNVEVLLPYDALAFLHDDDNDAEVVLSAKQAIVVRLNGFTVVDGRARTLQQASAHGDDDLPPPLPGQNDPADADATLSRPVQHIAETPVEIRERRVETPEEAALRQPTSRVWKMAGLWVLAFVLMLVVANADLGGARVPLLLAALAMAGAAVWWQWRRPAPAAPTKPLAVNRVHGPLRLVELPNPTNAALRTYHYFLGDALQVQMPAHWQHSGRLPLGQPVEMEILATSGEVLAMGSAWSQVDEARRFPAVRWGQHVVLLTVGLVALLAALLNNHGVIDDMALAWQGVRGGETRSDATAASLAQRPPRGGDRVRLRGEGQCELALTPLQDIDAAIVLPDCSRVRWGGTPVRLPGLQMPAALLSLYRGDYVSVREDNMSAMLRLLMLQQAGADPYAQAALSARHSGGKIVSGMGNLVEVVEQACAAGLEDCDALKRGIVEELAATADVDGRELALDSWPLLARELRRAVEEGNDGMLMPSSQLSALQDITRGHAGTAIARQLQTLAPQLLSLQQGGVVLATPHDLRGDADAVRHDAADVRAESVLDRWEQAMTTLATPVPFTVDGLVVGRHKDAAGLRLEVNTDADQRRIVAAAASTLALLLASALALGQAVLLCRAVARARARRRALDADMQTRPVPGLAS